MAKKFLITETIHSAKVKTVRLGASGAANVYTDKEVGKCVKLAAESQYNLCSVGDPIEGFIDSVNVGVYDGHSIGGIISTEYREVVADGLQATPGTGTIAVGDYVVAGTMVAKDTALTGKQKVCKATMQPGITEASAVGDVNDMLKVALFAWRVASLGTAGTGAVGTTIIIERVSV